MSTCAASELQMLDAMYPSALDLDPPGWHEADDPLLPVSGSLLVELPDSPPLTVHFRLETGYPESAEALQVQVSCVEASRAVCNGLNEWAARCVSQSAAGDHEAPLTEIVGTLADGWAEAKELADEPQPSAESQAVVVAQASSTEALSAKSAVQFAEPLPAGHSGLLEGRVDRQWITFISFTSAKIAKEFRAAAEAESLTGFLMVGKPGVACLEGGPNAIARFLRIVRTDVFAQIDPATRKMQITINEESCTRVRFDGFSVLDFSNTADAAVTAGKKQRPTRSDLFSLKEFLQSRGIVDKTFERVTMHAQHDV
eukprot:gnl/TRDRNA2_/TRDRNA2_203061_c0_seq1.p1 gnl/TRDRNA2_/TRDRNA2_203061_c0~~gnl/TRDRNA2_/TRDRNA2_203061_c0_seq1.p1  ORF type:complete len:320 (+),score=53.09 gnl/TRDRNA2_/TRDRNA2_203061_c0_seq1:23-961(+)